MGKDIGTNLGEFRRKISRKRVMINRGELEGGFRSLELGVRCF